MNKTLNIIRWVIAVSFIITAVSLLTTSIISAIAFAIIGVIVMPIEAVRNLRQKFKLNKLLTIVLIIVLFLVGGFTMPEVAPDVDTGSGLVDIDNDESSNTSSAAQSKDDDSSSAAEPVSSAVSSNEESEAVSSEKPVSSAAPVSVEPTPAPVDPTPVSVEPTQPDTNSQIVYLAPNPSVYHTHTDCRYIKNKNITEVTLSEAQSRGLNLCSTCAKKIIKTDF